jgi:hypothetical protein
LKAGCDKRGSAGRHEPGIASRANPPAQRERATARPVTQARFEELLQELTNKFGGVTSFVRAPGQGLWNSGAERYNIAVIEVMTDEIDPPFWQAFRRMLERELAQQEIVTRAQRDCRVFPETCCVG